MNDLRFFLKFLWGYLGLRLPLWAALIGTAAVLEGLSVALIFPLLEGADSGGVFTELIMGIFDLVHLEYSLQLVLGFMGVFFMVRALREDGFNQFQLLSVCC